MTSSRRPVRIDQAKWHANGAAATRGADCRCFEPNVAGLTSGLLKTGKMEGEHNGARHVRASSVGFRSGEAATEGSAGDPRALAVANLLHNDAAAGNAVA